MIAMDNEEKQAIIGLYQSGLSLAEITKHVSYKSPNSIKKILLTEGIQLRSKAGYRKPFNEDYFDVIDSEKKAYFLGYLMADGNVALREGSQPVVRMELNQKDRVVLERLKECLDTDIEVKNSRKNCCVLRIHSQHMFDSLQRYGIVPGKTGREILPDLPEAFVRHFIRGFFDGDGWFTNTTSHGKKPGSRKGLGFCGNYEMMTNLTLYLNSILGTNINKVANRGSWSMILFGARKDVDAIAEYMYHDATIFLQRKHDAYNQ